MKHIKHDKQKDFLFISEIRPLPLLEKPLCVSHQITFTSDTFNDDLFDQFNVPYPSNIQRAVKKRKAEYLAGRIIAQLGIATLTGQQHTIQTGPKREPIWPSGITGSISHTDSQAVCITTQYPRGLVGIDIEKIISKKTAKKISNNIITPKEMKVFEPISNDFSELLTIAFSCKESLFKALYPSVNIYFDFMDAEIIEANSNKLTLKLLRPLGHIFQQGQRFSLAYFKQEESILTYLIDPNHI